MRSKSSLTGVGDQVARLSRCRRLNKTMGVPPFRRLANRRAGLSQFLSGRVGRTLLWHCDRKAFPTLHNLLSVAVRLEIIRGRPCVQSDHDVLDNMSVWPAWSPLQYLLVRTSFSLSPRPRLQSSWPYMLPALARIRAVGLQKLRCIMTKTDADTRGGVGHPMAKTILDFCPPSSFTAASPWYQVPVPEIGMSQ